MHDRHTSGQELVASLEIIVEITGSSHILPPEIVITDLRTGYGRGVRWCSIVKSGLREIVVPNQVSTYRRRIFKFIIDIREGSVEIIGRYRTTKIRRIAITPFKSITSVGQRNKRRVHTLRHIDDSFFDSRICIRCIVGIRGARVLGFQKFGRSRHTRRTVGIQARQTEQTWCGWIDGIHIMRTLAIRHRDTKCISISALKGHYTIQRIGAIMRIHTRGHHTKIGDLTRRSTVLCDCQFHKPTFSRTLRRKEIIGMTAYGINGFTQTIRIGITPVGSITQFLPLRACPFKPGMLLVVFVTRRRSRRLQRERIAHRTITHTDQLFSHSVDR